MTNEDIIKGLTLMRKNFDSNSVYGSYCIDCLDAAIEALKAQSKHDQNVMSKQPDLETLGIKAEETCEDAISRQAAIDVILADKIDDTSLKVMTALGDGRLALTLNSACDRHIQEIEKLPSAQPEIIHCKECKFAHMTYDGDCKYCDVWFPDESKYVGGDYYCASAERKTDE